MPAAGRCPGDGKRRHLHPQNDVAYTLTLDDLIAGAGDAPVKVSRKDPADCYNRTTIAICDRTLGYIDNPIPFSIDQLIDDYGLRDNTSISADEICDPAVGAIVAQLVAKRAAFIRLTYQFTTSWKFLLCLPGTVLEIPLNHTGRMLRVRVTSISEDENGLLAFEAEEFPEPSEPMFPPRRQRRSPPPRRPTALLRLPVSTPRPFWNRPRA
jgi:hypothetical protein